MAKNKISIWWLIGGMAASIISKISVINIPEVGTNLVYFVGMSMIGFGCFFARLTLKHRPGKEGIDFDESNPIYLRAFVLIISCSYALFGWMFFDLILFFWLNMGFYER